MSNISTNDLLEWSIQFIHFEKSLAMWPGMSDEVSATLFGTDINTYHDIKANFAARTRQAAQELP